MVLVRRNRPRPAAEQHQTFPVQSTLHFPVLFLSGEPVRSSIPFTERSPLLSRPASSALESSSSNYDLVTTQRLQHPPTPASTSPFYPEGFLARIHISTQTPILSPYLSLRLLAWRPRPRPFPLPPAHPRVAIHHRPFVEKKKKSNVSLISTTIVFAPIPGRTSPLDEEKYCDQIRCREEYDQQNLRA